MSQGAISHSEQYLPGTYSNHISLAVNIAVKVRSLELGIRLQLISSRHEYPAGSHISLVVIFHRQSYLTDCQYRWKQCLTSSNISLVAISLWQQYLTDSNISLVAISCWQQYLAGIYSTRTTVSGTIRFQPHGQHNLFNITQPTLDKII